MKRSTLQLICLWLAGLAIITGGLGMAMSFLYLASADSRDISAGTSGFVAGAILIGSGLVSMTLLSTQGSGEESRPAPPVENAPPSRAPVDWRITKDRPSLQ